MQYNISMMSIFLFSVTEVGVRLIGSELTIETGGGACQIVTLKKKKSKVQN